MKKLFLLLVLMGMVVVGCSKDEEGSIPDDAYISLNKEIVTISPDGESVGVKVYSNYAWELTNNCDWITTSITSGNASDTGVTVTLTADLTYDDRDGTIVFSCGKAKKLLVVSQKFKEAIIPDANNTFNIPVEGGIAILNYQTTVDCEVIIPDDAQDWITIAPATRGLVSENINLDIAENTTYDSRSAVIKVVAKDNAALVVEYTINQVQNDAILVDKNNTFTVPSEGGNIEIAYQTNIDCDVVIPEEAQDWITIVPETRGLSTYSTTLNIAENNSDKERSCVVKVTSQDDNELFAEYTITQKPRYYLYYTSSNGEIVQPYDNSSFGATIISNTYIDGVGVIEFNAPITTIGGSAFANCTSLTSVTIPDSVTTIGYGAFLCCSSLQEFKSKFASEDGRCLIIDGTLNSFAPAGLVEYTIPDSVTTIGSYAFQYCSNLTSVTIPDSVTAIGNYAFENCSSLTSVTIPESVTSIGGCAFRGCSSLTSVTIGDSVTTIGYYAFSNCYSLTSVYITDLSAWCRINFGSYDANPLCYAKNLYLNNELVTVLVVPSDITEIKSYAFMGCRNLTSVTIGDSVTTIGYYAFSNCYSLTSVTIGDSVTTIGDCAFFYCSSLTSVTIPDGVTTIGEAAFGWCSNLTSVYCKATTPPAGDSEMFANNASGRKIYVPAESVGAYKSASYWSSYKSDIVGYDF